MRITTNQDTKEVDIMEQRLRKLRTHSVIIPALVLGVIWTMIYLIFVRMHGSWIMSDFEFPFLIRSILGLQTSQMSIASATLFSFTDGTLVGFVFSWLIVRLFAR